MTNIKAILIANRGEIACRIIRACREMGIRSIAVYSDADVQALHTRLADDAVHIGAAPACESYLNIEHILHAAKQANAEAIHPGYGFLAENARFAQAVIDAGLVFIGPSPADIRLMGDKTTAREIAMREGVAIAPGFLIPDEELDETLRAKANAIGYPLLIKAAAGGGGRGMRPVLNEHEFAAMIASAQHEAQAAFGDGRVYVEKLIVQPRHIEVQIMADAYGHVAHLIERECSIQRRHQKLIEESPSTFVSGALREKLYDAAVRLARASNYVNAGTVEFIVDATGAIYFLEMNTRLQVEHPVTEQVTGMDLVKAQINIAAGASLDEALSAYSAQISNPHPQPLSRSEGRNLYGHAIECRICAEDAANDFMPSTGRIIQWHEPQAARVDAGYSAGDVVTPHYDSLLAKVITHGASRAEAISRMKTSLAQFQVKGVTTNISFLSDAINHPAFARGETTTGFLQQYFSTWQPANEANEQAEDLQHKSVNPWHQRNRFRIGELNLEMADSVSTARRGQTARASTIKDASSVKNHIESPMPAMVRQVMASAGDVVKRGDALIVLEVMKMEQRLSAPRDGTVKTVNCIAGQSVERGQVLVEFENALSKS